MFLIILEQLMEEHDLNKNQLSKQSGIPYMTIKNLWDKGYSNIKLSTLKQIASFFNVTLDYLVFGENHHTSKVDNLYNNLNKTGKQKAMDYLNDLNDNPKYTSEDAKQHPPNSVQDSATSKQLQEDIAQEFADAVKKSTNRV